MQIKQLLTTPYQVRLDDHRPLGYFTASVAHPSMQKAAFSNSYLCLCQHIEDGGKTTEIVILLLVKQMYMDNLRHILFGIIIFTNILNNNYME